MKKLLTVQEIIQRSDWVKKGGMDWKTIYAGLHIGIEKNMVRVFRHGNTLAIYPIGKPGETRVDVCSADPDEKAIKSFVECLKAFKASGFHKITFVTKKIMKLNSLRRSGFKVDVSAGPKDQNGNPTWIGVIHV
jgi:hypothetical protein